MATIPELEAQIAALLPHLVDPPRSLPVYQVGDLVRVVADSRGGPKSPHIGDIGMVAEVRPKCEAMVVYHNCLDHIYLLDFGPDEACAGGRDTWAFADCDVREAAAPWKQQRGKRK